VIRRPGRVVKLGSAQPVHDGLEFGLHGLNFPVLPKHHVAQFRGGAFQEGDLGLDLLQSFIVHLLSVALIRGRFIDGARAGLN
jgi:hypothetical protein